MSEHLSDVQVLLVSNERPFKQAAFLRYIIISVPLISERLTENAANLLASTALFSILLLVTALAAILELVTELLANLELVTVLKSSFDVVTELLKSFELVTELLASFVDVIEPVAKSWD